MNVACLASTFMEQTAFSADPLHHCTSDSPQKALMTNQLMFPFQPSLSMFPITSSILYSSLAFLTVSSTNFPWPLSGSRKHLTLIYFTEKYLLSSYLLPKVGLTSVWRNTQKHKNERVLDSHFIYAFSLSLHQVAETSLCVLLYLYFSHY